MQTVTIATLIGMIKRLPGRHSLSVRDLVRIGRATRDGRPIQHAPFADKRTPALA